MNYKRVGPGFLVTAAFIGPGTIITCAASGIMFNGTLFWALIIGVFIAILFQDMAARLALHTGHGLSESILKFSSNRFATYLFRLLIILSIFFGNAAYESGNLLGASIGLIEIFGFGNTKIVVSSISLMIALSLWFGNYKFLEKVFIFLVFVMGVIFLLLFMVSDVNSLTLFNADYESMGLTNILFHGLTLVGTTVVPYNLFLHSKSISEKWKDTPSLRIVRLDLIFSILIGGIISLSIMFVFAASKSYSGEIVGLKDLTKGLELKYGNWTKYFVSTGIFLAGLTSSLTAPLAAKYAISGLFEIKERNKVLIEKAIWLTVLVSGFLVGSTSLEPIFLIQLAQFANGLLLPIIAILLLYALNRNALGVYKNGTFSNLIGALVVLLLSVLGLKSIFTVFNVW
jgi:manganese transport protein